jgi:hypothetical protein
MTDKFTCNNCSQELPIAELASTVPVYEDEPIRTCRKCYDIYHNPPKEKKVKENFLCSFCRFEVISVKYRFRVNVSEPNELGLKNGETYNFCSSCRRKVKEYNEAEDSDDEEKGPWS